MRENLKAIVSSASGGPGFVRAEPKGRDGGESGASHSLGRDEARPSQSGGPTRKNLEVLVASASGGQLLRRRQVRETLRSVWRVGSHLVKAFEYPENAKPHSRPWERERAALLRLYGEKAEAETAVFERTEGGMHRVWFVRPFVEGAAVETFAREEMPAVAVLMADLHAHGVVTDDASAGNFLRTADGRLVFMDFGRARIYRGRAPAWMAGKEIAKLYREGFGYDGELFRAFWRAYLCAARPGWFRRGLLAVAWRSAVFFRNLRKGRGR